MMIFFFIGFVNVLVLLKSCFFFCSYFFFDSVSLSLFYISNFCLVFFFFFFFNYKNYFESNSFYFFIFISLVFMNFCFFSDNTFYFILFFELSLIPMILLLNNFGKDSDKISSSFFMIFLNVLGSLPFFVSLGLFNFCFSSFSLLMVNNGFFIGSNSFIFFFLNGLIFFFKLPIIFFHFWLTKAHVSGSGSCSMILAGIMLKISVVGIFKFCFIFDLFYVMYFFSFFFVLSFIYLPLVMSRMFDFKLFVAISSILHMSCIPVMLYSCSFFPLLGSIFMCVGHGVISCMMFFFVSLIYDSLYNRSVEFFKSVSSVIHMVSYMFVFFFFLNFGLPPFLGFISEFFFFFFFFNQFSFYFSIVYFFFLFFLTFIIGFFVLKFFLGKHIFVFNSFDSLVVFFFFYYSIFNFYFLTFFF